MGSIPTVYTLFRGSSVVERAAVNRLVAGSIPALGALKEKGKDNVARQSKRYAEEEVQEM